MRSVEDKQGRVLVRVRVQPRASRNAVNVEPDGRIRISLTAPPAEGAANKALVNFVAEVIGIPRSAVTLDKGQKSREKTLSMAGVSAPHVLSKLADWEK